MNNILTTNAIEISATEDGTRLLRWFARHFPAVTSGEFHKLCRGGQIRINSRRVDGREILRTGDFVRIPPTIANSPKPIASSKTSGERFSLSDLEKVRKTIICDDSDFVAFNKPAGLAVQGGTGITKSLDKMASALFPYDTILPVHRLDRETSGVIIFAKNQRAAQMLSAEFQDKSASKEYLALLSGTVSPKSGLIDNFVAKGKVFGEGAEIEPHAQRAITKYEVLGELPGVLSFVRFLPKTGRTHQLRLHSAFTLGAPIVGDELYNRQENKDNSALRSILSTKHLFLFAHKLSFRHPTSGKMLTITAEPPSFMNNVIKFLEFKY